MTLVTIAYGAIIPFVDVLGGATILALSRVVSISSFALVLLNIARPVAALPIRKSRRETRLIGYSFWVLLMREWKAEVASILKTIIPP